MGKLIAERILRETRLVARRAVMFSELYHGMPAGYTKSLHQRNAWFQLNERLDRALRRALYPRHYASR